MFLLLRNYSLISLTLLHQSYTYFIVVLALPTTARRMYSSLNGPPVMNPSYKSLTFGESYFVSAAEFSYFNRKHSSVYARLENS